MANTHSQFKQFSAEIEITETVRASLRTSRNANREKIKKHFTEILGKEEPLFYGQGSYSMRNGVEPLSGNHDIDDGIYLQGLGTDVSKWPTTETVHGWIIAAVKGRTKEDPQSRKRCVRIPYQDYYHIDMPVYAEDENGLVRLFEKGGIYPYSSPRDMTDWFLGKNKVNPQIRDLVRYIKSWRDKQSLGRLKGLTITIMVCNMAAKFDRDDEAVEYVARAMANHLRYGGCVCKPVSPWEDLIADWTQEQRSAVVAKLDNLAARGKDALDEDDETQAAKIWRKEFGERFPVPVVKSVSFVLGAAATTPAPTYLGNDGRSA